MSIENYKPLPELIPQDIIDRFSKLSAAQLCDGMKNLGIIRNGCMDASMMPVDSSMRVVGTACTVSTEEGDNLPIHVAIYQSKPGYVLVVDGKNYSERAYMGDLMVGAAKAVGLNGVVVDGYVRDREGLKQLGLPVFCKGFMQCSPAKKGPGKINIPINCAGISVRPGDLIVGDYDGITVVPRKYINEVLENAEQKAKYEKKREEVIEEYTECINAGTKALDIAPAWVTEMLEKLK